MGIRMSSLGHRKTGERLGLTRFVTGSIAIGLALLLEGCATQGVPFLTTSLNCLKATPLPEDAQITKPSADVPEKYARFRRVERCVERQNWI